MPHPQDVRLLAELAPELGLSTTEADELERETYLRGIAGLSARWRSRLSAALARRQRRLKKVAATLTTARRRGEALGYLPGAHGITMLPPGWDDRT